MSWECRELLYELKSPLHIGKGQKLGIIDRTRYYIPGKTMWGATVAKIGKEKGLSNDDDWGELKEFVKENIIFTYFYIYDKKNSELLPEYGEDGLKYGDLSEQQFENKYITSFASAGVEKKSGAASDGDLHEIELIKDKTGPDEPVFIKGYVFTDEDGFDKKEKYDLENFIDHTKELQIGGERNYGYGKVTRDDIHSEQEKIFGRKVDLDEESPKIKLDGSNDSNEEQIHTLAHLIVKDEDGKLYFNKIDSMRGDLEPLVGREYGENEGSGKNTCFGGVGLVPGSKFEKPSSKFGLDSFTVEEGEEYEPSPIFIGDFGVWEFG